MENERKLKKRKTGAIFLIVTGIILLLNNLGLLEWEIWLVLWKSWPLLLILIGIEIVLGRSSQTRWLVTIIGLVFVALIITAFFALTPLRPNLRYWFEHHFFKFPENFQFYPEPTEERLTFRRQFLLHFH